MIFISIDKKKIISNNRKKEIIVCSNPFKIVFILNEIKTFNLNNYTITNGTINNDNVNIRLSPSVSGQKYTRQLFNNNTLRVVSIENRSKINNMIDYWYGIDIENIRNKR
jgi:hypothetical protein